MSRKIYFWLAIASALGLAGALLSLINAQSFEENGEYVIEAQNADTRVIQMHRDWRVRQNGMIDQMVDQKDKSLGTKSGSTQ